MKGLRRRWWVVIVAAVLVVAASGLLLSSLLEPVDETWERVVETGVLRVCTDPSWPPFELLSPDTGEIDGFDIELARLLAERMAPGLSVEVVSVGFDSLYDALLAGRCDAVLSALPYDPLRTKDAAYSIAYFNAGPVLLVRADTSGIESVEDLEGRMVGVDWGFVPEGDSRQRELLRNLPVERYDTAVDALHALRAGEVEAAIVDAISALSTMQEFGGLRIMGEPLYDVNCVIAVRPDAVLLLDKLDATLLEMRQDGTLEALQERWF